MITVHFQTLYIDVKQNPAQSPKGVCHLSSHCLTFILKTFALNKKLTKLRKHINSSKYRNFPTKVQTHTTSNIQKLHTSKTHAQKKKITSLSIYIQVLIKNDKEQ